MIKYFSGTPGSGKSLQCARIILNRMRTKNCVTIANFPIDEGKIKHKSGHFLYIENEFLTPKRLVDFSRNYSEYLGRHLRENEVLVIIDEAEIPFGVRDWNSPLRKDWVKFFPQHRKYGFTFILVSQFQRQIDKQIRELFEYEYIHRKITNSGKKGFFLKCLFLGDLFVSVQVWAPMKERIGANFFRASKKLYSIYDTNMIFEEQ